VIRTEQVSVNNLNDRQSNSDSTVKQRTRPKRKRVTKLPEVRREELLEVASALFLEKGIAATSVGDITDRAKVARGTFYLYFQSKDELVSVLWQRYVDGFLQVISEISDRPEAVHPGATFILELISRLTEHALDHAHLHRLVYGTADAAAIALCKRSDEAILSRLAEAIRRYFRRAGVPETEADLVASLLFHGLDGALHNAIMRDEPIDRSAFIEAVKGFAARVLLKPNIGT